MAARQGQPEGFVLEKVCTDDNFADALTKGVNAT